MSTPSSPGAPIAITVESPWRSLSRSWRIARTALGFACFGISVLLLTGVVLPTIRLLPGAAERKELRSQKMVHWFVRAYLRCIRLLRVMSLSCEGSERLRQPGILVVANHPTLIDALVLMSFMPQADLVVSSSRYENPMLSGITRAAGYVSNVDGPGLVEACVERLRRGRSVIVFPEGTRSPANQLGPFARGAAHIALRAGCDLVPVAVQCEPATLYRGLAWWDVPDRRFTLSLRVEAPLVVADCVDATMSRPRAARVLTASLRDHFERQRVVG